jgi:hypothetical protein
MKRFAAILCLLSPLALAETLYFENGDYIDVPEGSKIYIHDGQAFYFTKFDDEGFDIRPLEPAYHAEEPADEPEQEDCLTFGGGSCAGEEEEVIEVEIVVEECDAFTFGGSECMSGGYRTQRGY